MDTKQYVVELRAKASKQRVIARQSNDSEKAHKIFKRAEDLEKEARDIEKEW